MFNRCQLNTTQALCSTGVHGTPDAALAVVSSESAVGGRCDGGDDGPGSQRQDEDPRAGAGAAGREGRRPHRNQGKEVAGPRSKEQAWRLTGCGGT